MNEDYFIKGILSLKHWESGIRVMSTRVETTLNFPDGSTLVYSHQTTIERIREDADKWLEKQG